MNESVIHLVNHLLMVNGSRLMAEGSWLGHSRSRGRRRVVEVVKLAEISCEFAF